MTLSAVQVGLCSVETIAGNEHLQRFHSPGEDLVETAYSTSAFIFKNLLRHYAKWAPKHGK